MSFFFTARSYSDFDAYSESVKTWDLEFHQLGLGRFNAQIVHFGDADFQVGHVRYNKLLLQNGSAPATGYTFAVHHPDSAPFFWRYQDFLPDSIIVFPGNRELHGVSQPGHHPFIVTIAETFLAETAHLIGLPEPDRFICKGKVCRCKPAHINKVQELLTTLCSPMEVTRGQLSPTFWTCAVKRKLSSQILISLAGSKDIKPRKRNFSNRKDAVDRILELVNEDLSEPRSINELCNIAAVNERTLRNIFYEHFSLSPKKFLNRYKLNEVRRMLLQKNPDLTHISDIANQYGFWHLGQFAADYRLLFGELPSQTFANMRSK